MKEIIVVASTWVHHPECPPLTSQKCVAITLDRDTALFLRSVLESDPGCITSHKLFTLISGITEHTGESC